jgi:hypothetical protein
LVGLFNVEPVAGEGAGVFVAGANFGFEAIVAAFFLACGVTCSDSADFALTLNPS